MKVDHVLILAAGKGTRMGEIGKLVPKVLWPIGKKSILEHEIEYAKMLAPEAKIYINNYFYKEKISQFFNEKGINASLINEESELDIGGAVHNLAQSLGYRGNLLIINSDQFLFFDRPLFSNALAKLESSDSILFCHEVNKSEGYNKLDHDHNMFLKQITPYNETKESKFLTYTGMSLVKLESLKPDQGKSKFFSTVANPMNTKVELFPITNYEYWDYGTLKLYHENLFKLGRDKTSSFNKFLIDRGTSLEQFYENEMYSFVAFQWQRTRLVIKA